MAIEGIQTLAVIEAMENFIDSVRPPENLRNQVDLSYKIDEQSVVIFEIRPKWKKPEEKIESNIAKTTFVKAKNQWKVFWFRADLKWHSYTPKPIVKSLDDFLQLVKEDKNSCFWG